MNNIVTWENHKLAIIEYENQKWFSSVDIARALNFAKENAVTKIYNNHKSEFEGGLSCLPKSGKQRLFNREGAWLIGMFARTPKAAEFRKWVLKVLGAVANNQLSTAQVDMKAIGGAVCDEQENRVVKNFLTTCRLFCYDNLTELHSGQPAPIDIADFFIPEFRGMRSPNTLNKARSLCTSVESPACSSSGGLTESIEKMKELISYTFKNTQIRTTVINNEPWFVATDVAQALEYRDSEHATRYLDDDEKDTLNQGTPGKQLTIINESGLYSLVLRSRKPEARAFKKFVTAEVLPSIRKTGGYGTPAPVDMKAIGGVVKKCAAVAVRDELASFLLKDGIKRNAEMSNGITADGLPYMSWIISIVHGANALQDCIEQLRQRTSENDLLKSKLETIKKVVS